MWLSSDKKYTFTGLLLLLSLFIQAQQDPMYSQYMYNMMSVNPAYAGSKGGIHALLLHRQQWTDIEGAPTTQNFTIHSPFMDDKRMAVAFPIPSLPPVTRATRSFRPRSISPPF